MSTLNEQLATDLADAMRSGDKRRRDVIRYLRAAIKNAEIDRQAALDDQEIEALIRFQIKQRRDSIDQFRKGKRDDLADEELAQIEVLQAYLPAQLSDEELRAVVIRIVDSLGATSPKDMSRVMPAVIAEVGSSAEGRRISQMVSGELSSRAAQTSR